MFSGGRVGVLVKRGTSLASAPGGRKRTWGRRTTHIFTARTASAILRNAAPVSRYPVAPLHCNRRAR
jgi:hypothetical protein